MSAVSAFSQLKEMISGEATKARFQEILGKKAPGFMSSILSVVNSNQDLQVCDPKSVLMAASIAATLDLPINPNLGFAAIVPYKNKGGSIAQFQMMYKGFIQLAERSGQYQRINASIVYDGQLIREDPFAGDYEFDYYAKKSDTIIGYMAYIRLNNGFEKYLYMPEDEVKKHAKKYSQTYKRGFGKWMDDFDAMALKTVLKLLLSKYGILSIEMQHAVTFDQAEVRGNVNHIEDVSPEYVDNEPAAIDAKIERLKSKKEEGPNNNAPETP